MTYPELIKELEKIADEGEMLFKVFKDIIYVESFMFSMDEMSAIQDVLEAYHWCRWIVKSGQILEGGVMYRVCVIVHG